MKKKLVCGVGINDYDGKININGQDIKSYKTWRDILNRCYNEKERGKYPTYQNVVVCDEWFYFSNFKKWYDENYRWDLVAMGIRLDLDKDLLSGDSKIYSPKTCCFIPHKINGFMTNKRSSNTSGYTGVSWNKKSNKWQVRIRRFIDGKLVNLGSYVNIEDANKMYVKERKIQSLQAKELMKSLGYNKQIIDNIN